MASTQQQFKLASLTNWINIEPQPRERQKSRIIMTTSLARRHYLSLDNFTFGSSELSFSWHVVVVMIVFPSVQQHCCFHRWRASPRTAQRRDSVCVIWSFTHNLNQYIHWNSTVYMESMRRTGFVIIIHDHHDTTTTTTTINHEIKVVGRKEIEESESKSNRMENVGRFFCYWVYMKIVWTWFHR